MVQTPMTAGTVFITAGGARWHSRPDCEALAHGQEEARASGYQPWPIQQVSPTAVEERQPCTHCVSSEQSRDVTAAGRLPRAETTRYEDKFQQDVLDRSASLSGWTVERQREFVFGSRRYRPDFALTKDGLHLIIEIDGFDKGPSQPSHDEWTERQNIFVAHGWEILRFTNRQVAHEPGECRATVTEKIANMEAGGRQVLATAPAPPATTNWADESHIRIGGYPVNRNEAMSPGSSSRLWLWVLLLVTVAAGATTVAIYLVQQHQDQDASGGVKPSTRSNGYLFCPTSRPIKGNVSESGTKIYWVPGSAYYDRTKPERCFSTTTAAESEGFRAPNN